MKRISLYVVSVCLWATYSLGVCACNGPVVPQKYKQALQTMYPKASHVDWDFDDGYYSAEFHLDNTEIKVYFDMEAKWFKRKTEYRTLSQLPAPIQQAVKSSQYAAWKVEDIELLEWADKTGNEDYYKIEVERGETEYDFYLRTDGKPLR